MTDTGWLDRQPGEYVCPDPLDHGSAPMSRIPGLIDKIRQERDELRGELEMSRAANARLIELEAKLIDERDHLREQIQIIDGQRQDWQRRALDAEAMLRVRDARVEPVEPASEEPK